MRISFYTLGCKLNQSESEALASGFGSRGFSVGGSNDGADIFIVSTCTVTSKAEQKARRMIRKFSRENPEAMIIITGCYVQLDRELLEDFVDNTFLVSQEDKDVLLELPGYLSERNFDKKKPDPKELKEALKTFFRLTAGESVSRNPFAFNAEKFSYHARASLKIQDGCDNACAYCRVTLARGDSISLQEDEILERLAALEEKGYREIILTGINITSWKSPGTGPGKAGRRDFPYLINRITESVKNTRIRISSIEPETITRELVAALSHPSVCPHFHISVQSGANRILAGMRRRNNRETIIKGVNMLKESIDNPFIAADVIVGFPGETEEDFLLSYSLVEDLGFSELHVFPFSARPGTAAVNMKNKVPQRIAGERTVKLRELSDRLHESYLDSCTGKSFGFLLEQKFGPDDLPVISAALDWGGDVGLGVFSGNPGADYEGWYGISENYLKLPVLIKKDPDGTLQGPPAVEKGKIIKCSVKRGAEKIFFAEYL